MPSIDIHNCLMGAITSRVDHSVAFRVITPELRASESGALMGLHGCSVRVVLFPHDKEIEPVNITTDRDTKTASQRLRSVLYALHQHEQQTQPFAQWYEAYMERIINHIKDKLP